MTEANLHSQAAVNPNSKSKRTKSPRKPQKFKICIIDKGVMMDAYREIVKPAFADWLESAMRFIVREFEEREFTKDDLPMIQIEADITKSGTRVVVPFPRKCYKRVQKQKPLHYWTVTVREEFPVVENTFIRKDISARTKKEACDFARACWKCSPERRGFGRVWFKATLQK